MSRPNANQLELLANEEEWKQLLRIVGLGSRSPWRTWLQSVGVLLRYAEYEQDAAVLNDHWPLNGCAKFSQRIRAVIISAELRPSVRLRILKFLVRVQDTRKIEVYELPDLIIGARTLELFMYQQQQILAEYFSCDLVAVLRRIAAALRDRGYRVHITSRLGYFQFPMREADLIEIVKEVSWLAFSDESDINLSAEETMLYGAIQMSGETRRPFVKQVVADGGEVPKEWQVAGERVVEYSGVIELSSDSELAMASIQVPLPELQGLD